MDGTGTRPPGDADRRFGIRVVAGVIALCVAVVGWAAAHTPVGGPARPAPAAARLVQRIAPTYTVPGTAPALPWPAAGQAAVYVEGAGSLGSSGNTAVAVPIASVAKTMTAYLVLADHPLGPNDQGPEITVTAADAAGYPQGVKQGQSLVKVQVGEQLTERQALDALMLASADNVAWILARWDGGRNGFVARMNAAAAALGMTRTRYTDPSGLDPGTVSTAPDQVKLALAAEGSAALQRIVAQASATIPVQGAITNYNKLLGRDGVSGMKTGSTSQAGGCLLFSATAVVGGRPVTLVGAVLGQPLGTGAALLSGVLRAAQRLVAGAEAALTPVALAVPGAEAALLRGGGRPDRALGVPAPVTLPGWPGLRYQLAVSGPPSAPRLAVAPAGSADAPVTAPLVPLGGGSGRSAG